MITNTAKTINVALTREQVNQLVDALLDISEAVRRAEEAGEDLPEGFLSPGYDLDAISELADSLHALVTDDADFLNERAAEQLQRATASHN